MFSKKNRLAKTLDVQRVFSKGRAFFNPLFTVRYLSGNGQHRFTVVVSTKVSKLAVKRNRIKRVAREFIRLRLSGFRPGDYAVMVKPAAAKKEADEWRKSLEELLVKARLIG
jgi:ribonuclease P protein component